MSRYTIAPEAKEDINGARDFARLWQHGQRRG
jgi:hypothetical protein